MSSWEERMALRTAERTARRKAAEAEAETGLPGHEGHHAHVQGNGLICSCGEIGLGCFSFVPDGRWWSDDPAERAAVEREEADWQAWISCWICGEPGVTAAEGLSWPPRTISR